MMTQPQARLATKPQGDLRRRRRQVMLVSADAGAGTRHAVSSGERPMPEFLALEEMFGVELLDWSVLAGNQRGRTVGLALRHVARVIPELGTVDAVLSDGEHLGMPLGLAMGISGRRPAHVMIGHRMLRPSKARLFRAIGGQRTVARILVHSERQGRLAPTLLRMPPDRVRVVPYGVDDHFWAPAAVPEEPDLVFAAGREHRDYRLLARACADEPARVFITDHSAHSPQAHRTGLQDWPANVHRQARGGFEGVRDMYARAAVVAVPLVDTDFPAGITAVLEAMAMGKAVVASATRDMSEVVDHGRTGLLVPPGNERAMRAALGFLLGDPAARQRLGRQAREAVIRRHTIRGFAAAIAQELREASGNG